MPERAATTVAVLVFDGAPLFETAVPISVFGVDRPGGPAPAFTLLAVAAEPGPLRSTGGLRVEAPHGLEALGRAGIVVVPTWRSPGQPPPEGALAALREAHRGGAIVVGLCLGAFVVAAAGLLDGRRSATHWQFAAALAAAHPSVEVDDSVLFVDHGDVLTSAGSAAGIDACLHLVRRLWGAAAGNAIARQMVVPPQRLGGQAQFIEHPIPARADDDGVADSLAYALAHLGDDLDIDALAERAHLSRRSFDRRFRLLTGSSPGQWLLHQRVRHAQDLLESTDLTVDAIARRVGLAAGVSLRPAFRRIVGTTPQAYRDTFRTTPGA